MVFGEVAESISKKVPSKSERPLLRDLENRLFEDLLPCRKKKRKNAMVEDVQFLQVGVEKSESLFRRINRRLRCAHRVSARGVYA